MVMIHLRRTANDRYLRPAPAVDHSSMDVANSLSTGTIKPRAPERAFRNFMSLCKTPSELACEVTGNNVYPLDAAIC